MNDFPHGHFKVGHGLNINTHSYQPPQISDPSSLYNPAGAYPYTPAHPAFAHPHPATRHVQQLQQLQHSHLAQQQLQNVIQQQQQQQAQAQAQAQHQQQQQQQHQKNLIQQQQQQHQPPPRQSHSVNKSSSTNRHQRPDHNAGRDSPAEPQDLVKQKSSKLKSRYQDKAVETDHRRREEHHPDKSNDQLYEDAGPADMFLEAKMEYESSVDDMEDTESRVHEEMKSPAQRKPCPECGKLLTNVREHVKSVHWQVKNYVCEFCPYSTSFKTDLSKHRKSRHSHIIDQMTRDGVTPVMNSPATQPSNNSNFVASKTPVNYLPPPAQKRPAMPVTQTKLTPDSPIGALLPTQITYAGHGNQQQQNTGNTEVAVRARAVTHQVQYHGKHTPDTPIGALIPDQQHSTGGVAIAHTSVAVHHTELANNKGKKFKDCEECGKPVINMNEHIRYVHRREKNFSCTDCDYKTLFKCDLVKHQSAVHQKIRKVCSFCGKHVANLSEHTRFVHKQGKKHKCDSCNYACVKPSDLRKHQAAVHKWSRGLVPTTIDTSQLETPLNRKGEAIKVEDR